MGTNSPRKAVGDNLSVKVEDMWGTGVPVKECVLCLSSRVPGAHTASPPGLRGWSLVIFLRWFCLSQSTAKKNLNQPPGHNVGIVTLDWLQGSPVSLSLYYTT